MGCPWLVSWSEMQEESWSGLLSSEHPNRGIVVQEVSFHCNALDPQFNVLLGFQQKLWEG